MQLIHIARKLGIGEVVDDPAMLHHVVPVGDRSGKAEILLDQQDGKTLGLERADGAPDLLDDDRGQALGRLVEQQEPRAVCGTTRAIASICCSPPDSLVP